MNADTTLILARDRAAELLAEAHRERLARQADEARRADSRKAVPTPRWSFLSLRRAPASPR